MTAVIITPGAARRTWSRFTAPQRPLLICVLEAPVPPDGLGSALRYSAILRCATLRRQPGSAFFYLARMPPRADMR